MDHGAHHQQEWSMHSLPGKVPGMCLLPKVGAAARRQDQGVGKVALEEETLDGGLEITNK